MSTYGNEQNSVNGPPCSYASLSTYNGMPFTIQNSGSQYGTAGSTIGVQVVPDYSTVGYDALTHGAGPSCSGYFNITSAYGSGAENCNTQYMQRMCGGGGSPYPMPTFSPGMPTTMPPNTTYRHM